MARPRFHILATAPFAWGAYRRWGLSPALGMLASGIFVDLDHLVDYAWVRFYGQRSHFLAPLHAWELVVLGGAFAVWSRWLRCNGDAPSSEAVERQPSALRAALSRTWAQGLATGLAAGLFVHLVQDVLTNRPRHAGVYALAYRVAHRFRRDRIGWEHHGAFHDWSGRPWYTWI
ncbi:MAG: hypothetical protein ACRDI2_03945 [Chloroflexota bacterium]